MSADEAVKLGYEINEALGLYLDAKSIADEAGYDGYEYQAEVELRQILWDNKAGIIAYLLGGSAETRHDEPVAKR